MTVQTWTFELVGDRKTTDEEENAFDWCDELAGGEISYIVGGGNPIGFWCDIEAETLEEAIAEAKRLIALPMPGLVVSENVPEGFFDCKG